MRELFGLNKTRENMTDAELSQIIASVTNELVEYLKSHGDDNIQRRKVHWTNRVRDVWIHLLTNCEDDEDVVHVVMAAYLADVFISEYSIPQTAHELYE